MNSLSRKESERILNETLFLLNGAVLRRKIDDPIDRAATTFPHKVFESEIVGNMSLLRAAGEFVMHIYRNGLAFPRVLSHEDAQGEALFLIEQRYQGTDAVGFEGILLEMLQCGRQGWYGFFLVLAEIVKENQRERYVQWVLNTRIRRLDWRASRDLTALVLQRWASVFRDRIFKRPVEQLVPACADLIYGYVTSNEALRK